MTEPGITSVPLVDTYKSLWAKSSPRHPLWKHLLDAASVSLALPPKAVEGDWGPNEIALLVGLHDLGKADSAFQHQVPAFTDELVHAGFPSTADARCRHERISARFIKESLLTDGLDPFVVDAVVRAVAAHHGHWDESARPVGRAYRVAQGQLCTMLRRVLRVESMPGSVPSNLSRFGMLLTGHIVLSDWIASNEKFFRDERLRGLDDPEEYFALARIVASEWTRRLGLEGDGGAGSSQGVVDLARPIQQALLDHDLPPGLVIIEAPMGEGKTEAAWILAERWRAKGYSGMYMALPTMATSDSLHDRYRVDYLQRLGRSLDAKLVHGMAWLRDEQESDAPVGIGDGGDDGWLAAAWFRPTRRAMLATHGVGTVDQAMLAGMNVRFGFLRLYGLVDRVLVIDEVHAYDAYMSAIICRLLEWCACLEIPVILLSATLSAEQRARMMEAYGVNEGDDKKPNTAYPLITVAESGKTPWTIEAKASSAKTLKIEVHAGLLGKAEEVASMAEDLVMNGGCCCVILNTVKQAQAVYRELSLSESQKLLFHARFKASDRQRITQRVLNMFGRNRSNRPERFVLVATQVVEQSLDVDFDYMISEIAPIDLLLQRSGRMHRHGVRSYDPTLHVMVPARGSTAFGGTGYVYSEKPLLRTLAILDGIDGINLPDDFRTLIEQVYGTGEWDQSAVSWDAVRKADENWVREIESLQQKGKVFSLISPSHRFFRPVENTPTGDDSDDGNGWRAMTRLGANDQTTLLIGEDEVHRLEVGEMALAEVRSLYGQSVKLASYLPTDKPAPGFRPAVPASGRLRGLQLLPMSDQNLWCGVDDRGNRYEVRYDNELGLIAGKSK